MKQIARERFETAWLSNPEIFSVHELPDCSDHAFYATWRRQTRMRPLW